MRPRTKQKAPKSYHRIIQEKMFVINNEYWDWFFRLRYIRLKSYLVNEKFIRNPNIEILVERIAMCSTNLSYIESPEYKKVYGEGTEFWKIYLVLQKSLVQSYDQLLKFIAPGKTLKEKYAMLNEDKDKNIYGTIATPEEAKGLSNAELDRRFNSLIARGTKGTPDTAGGEDTEIQTAGVGEGLDREKSLDSQ